MNYQNIKYKEIIIITGKSRLSHGKLVARERPDGTKAWQAVIFCPFGRSHRLF